MQCDKIYGMALQAERAGNMAEAIRLHEQAARLGSAQAAGRLKRLARKGVYSGAMAGSVKAPVAQSRKSVSEVPARDKMFKLGQSFERAGCLVDAINCYKKAWEEYRHKEAGERYNILSNQMLIAERAEAADEERRRTEEKIHRAVIDSGQRFLEEQEKAMRGDLEAAFKTGKRYCSGIGVERDLQKALMWLYYAFDNGYVNASAQIDYIERNYNIKYDGAKEGLPDQGEVRQPKVVGGDGEKTKTKTDPKVTDGEPESPKDQNPIDPIDIPDVIVDKKPNEVKLKPPQRPAARFKIWHVPEFGKEVDKAFGTRQAFLWDKFDTYIEDLATFEAELKNNLTVQMFTLRFGADEIAIKKFRIDDASRAFFVQLDESLASRLDVMLTNDGICPAAGDYCFIGVTRGGEHERQNPYGRIVGKRFLMKRAVELYTPESEIQDEDEDQNDRTRRLNVAVASYALNLPFKSYQDYCDNLSDADIKLSEEQFGILENIVKDDTKRLTLLMGCAGSGKTLMAVTLLLCDQYGGQGGRLYFALSDRLAVSSEASFCKIAVCKAVEAVPVKERPAFERLKSEIIMSRGKLKVTDLEGYAVRCGVNAQSAKEAFLSVRPEFNNANHYLMKLTGVNEKSFVNYERFRKWLKDEYGSDLLKGLNADDIWTEIRGLIKGYLGSRSSDPDRCWYWGNTTYHMIGDVFKGLDEKPNRKVIADIQASLKRHKVVEIPGGVRKDFVFVDLSEGAEKKVLGDCRQHSEWVKKLFAIVRNPDYSKRGLGINEYVGLRDEESVYSKEQREQIYAVFEAYDEWLKDKGFFDENDLARKVIFEHAQDHLRLEPSPAVLVVDECQDFTEMQLLALYQLAGEKTRVIFAGDRHQIINPTYFDPERIKKMPGIGRFDPHFIKDNHRSSFEIVRISNVVSAKRRRAIGSFDKKYEEDERSDTQGFYPHFLCYGENVKTFAKGLEEVIEDPQAAIIVHCDEDKLRLKSILPENKKAQLDVVAYTIRECKGLEFKKVFCFDILTEYGDVWQKILSSNVRHGQKYRYYFNTLYVSITRSQNGICLVESDAALKLHDEWLVKEGGFRRNTPANFHMLTMEFDLKIGSAREWLRRAQEYLEKAEGSDDVESFKHVRLGFTEAMGRVDADDYVKTEALRGQAICDVNILKLQNRLREAMQMCIDHQLIDLLPETAPEDEDLQQDLEIVRSVVEDGFVRIAKEDIPKAVALFSRTDKAREFLELGESIQREYVITRTNEMANEIAMI